MGSKWDQIPLEKMCLKIGSGATPRGGSEVYSNDNAIALIRSQNVYNNSFDRGGLVYISNAHAHQLSNVTIEINDVLLNITGDSVARCCIVADDVIPARVNQHVAIVRTNHNILDSKFLCYYLVSSTVQQYLLALSHAGATRKALTKGMIEKLDIPTPPLDVQRRVAEILGSLDGKIELNRRMNGVLEGTARAIFRAWFVDFEPVKAKAAGASHFPGLPQPLFDQLPTTFSESELGPIPSGWKVGTIADYAQANSWTLGKRDILDEIDYIEISEVMRGDIGSVSHYERGSEPSRARRRLRHGDTGISTVRPDRGAYFLSLNPSDSLIASTGFAVLTPSTKCWAFLHLITTGNDFFQELGRIADGGAYPAIRPEMIMSQPVISPTEKPIIPTFDAIVQPLFLKAAKNRIESQSLATLRDTLLPKLISGELRVGDASTMVREATR